MPKAVETARRMLVAKESFTKFFDGTNHVFIAGQTRVREGQPILEGVEHLFVLCDAHYEIEQASQGPGEVREG